MCHLAQPESEHLEVISTVRVDRAPHARAVTVLKWAHIIIEDGILSIPHSEEYS